MLHINYIAPKPKGYSLLPRSSKTSDLHLMLETSIPSKKKVNVTNGDIKVPSILAIKKKQIFNGKTYLSTPF